MIIADATDIIARGFFTSQSRDNMMRNRLIMIAITALFVLAAVHAATPQTAPPEVKKSVIHAARLLDVKTGKTLENQSIYVEDGKIVRIEPGFPKSAPGQTEFHLVKATVLPGLIDCHVHLTFN